MVGADEGEASPLAVAGAERCVPGAGCSSLRSSPPAAPESTSTGNLSGARACQSTDDTDSIDPAVCAAVLQAGIAMKTKRAETPQSCPDSWQTKTHHTLNFMMMHA